MKQPSIVLMVDHNIINIILMPAHNYTNKSNILGESSLLIFHSGSVATIIWSDDSQNLNIQVRTIHIVIKFNIFIQKACGWDFVCPHNSCTNEGGIHRICHCCMSLLWSSIVQLWSSMEIILLFNFPDQI